MSGFWSAVGEIAGVSRLDLIEKDFNLHRILREVSKASLLGRNLLFKGGTCLIKGFLGYYRFSEDLDFTWRDQAAFSGCTGKRQREILGDVLDEAATLPGRGRQIQKRQQSR